MKSATEHEYFGSCNAQLQRDVQVASQVADCANRALLCEMSDALQPPLAKLLAMVKEVCDGPLSGQQREHLFGIRQSAGDLMCQLGDAMFLSAPRSANDVKPVTFEVPKVLAEMRDHAVALVSELPVQIIWARTPACPAHWSSDPDRLKAALMHLIDAAISLASDGTIRLSTSLGAFASGRACLEITICQRPGAVVSPSLDGPTANIATCYSAEMVDQAQRNRSAVACCRRLVEELDGRFQVNSGSHVAGFSATMGIPYRSGPC